jgi:predicted flap endonuclease-1-like 5' DNA nuclease
MDTEAYKKFSATATEMTKTIVQGQVQLFEMFAENAKGTPMAPFFDAATKMQRATLDGMENLNKAVQKEPTKARVKKAAKEAAAPLEATTKAIKKAVDAQADMMVKADAAAVKAQADTKEAVKKATESAAKGDMATLYDDLTAVTGIGPSTMKKLQSEGIRTINDLATMSAGDLSDILEKANVRMLKYAPEDWITDAKSLMKAAKAA